MNLCVLTMRLFDRPRTGGELCTARLLLGLQQAGHTVTVLGLGQGDPQAASGRQVSLGEWLPAFADMPAARRARMLLGAMVHRRPASVERLHEPGAARAVARFLALHGAGLDALIVDHLQPLDWLRPLLRRGQALPPLMLVAHNLESQGYRELASASAGPGARATARRWMLQREARLLARLERLAAQRVRLVACLTDDDARALRGPASPEPARAGARARPAPPAVVVLPGFALPAQPGPTASAACGLSAADVARRLAVLPAHRRRIGLLGTWTWAPNRAGLQWLLDEVLPHCPEGVQLVLAGAGLDGVAPMGRDPRITVLGRIDEVDSFYRGVDVVAIPSVQGTGVHEKAIEAIGRGMPVVATPHALRGLIGTRNAHDAIDAIKTDTPGGPSAAPLHGGLPAHVQVHADARAFAQACLSVPLAVDLAAGQAWSRDRQQRYAAVLGECLGTLARPAPAPALRPASAQLPEHAAGAPGAPAALLAGRR